MMLTESIYDHCTEYDRLDTSGTSPIATSSSQDPRWKQSTVEAQLYYTIDPKTDLFCEILLHTDNYFCIYSDDVFWNEFLADWNMNDTDSPMEKDLNLPIDTTVNSKFRYCALVGALLWIATCTRPGILFAITYKGTVAKLWVGSGVDGKVQALLHGRVGVVHVPVGQEFVPEHIV